jgi:DedD protein
MSLDSPQSQLNDQEIQFKKRARRRLVGAIALVLLMIAVLPMVLDDRTNKAPPQEIAISIPSQDGGEFTSKIVPTAPVTAAPDADTDANPEPVIESSPEQKNPAELNETPVADVPPVKPAPVVKTEVPVEKPVRKEPAKASVQTADIANVSPAKLPDDKKLATAGVIAPVYVQIGVFSDAGNIKQLQQKLSGMGLKSFTEKIDTSKGEKTRLRAGPFANRPAAEAALEKIKAGGLGGMVVSK